MPRGTAAIAKRNKLITDHEWVVHYVARRFRTRAIEYDDMAQEGYLGLIRAAKTFAPSRGLKFATYASYWVRSYIGRAVARANRDHKPINPHVKRPHTNGRAQHLREHVVWLNSPVGPDGEEMVIDTLEAPTMNPEDATVVLEMVQTLERLIGVAAGGQEHHLKVAQARFLTDTPFTLTEVGEALGMSREYVRCIEQELVLAVQEMARITLRL